jgi:Tol biopolymer transport system component
MKNKAVRMVSILIGVLFAVCLILGTVVVISQLHGISFQGKIAIQGYLDSQNVGIFLYDRIFHTLKRITPKNIYVVSPAWSPDGKKIAFLYAENNESNFHIAVLDVVSQKTDSLIYGGIGNYLFDQDTALAWSPDGKLLMVDATSGKCRVLFLYQLDDKVSRPLNIQFCQSDDGLSVYRLNLSWSPNDIPLIGVSYQRSYYPRVDDIYTLDSTFTKPIWVTKGSGPVWRPRTNEFAYICQDTNVSYPKSSMCLFSTENGLSTAIITDYGYDQYTWSPDGDSILYVETGGESDPVFLSLVNLKTGEKFHLRPLFSSLDQYLIPREWGGGTAIWSP